MHVRRMIVSIDVDPSVFAGMTSSSGVARV